MRGCRYGAYSPAQVYTAAEVAELVTYAQDRGVRIIPELDAPAHVGTVPNTVVLPFG